MNKYADTKNSLLHLFVVSLSPIKDLLDEDCYGFISF